MSWGISADENHVTPLAHPVKLAGSALLESDDHLVELVRTGNESAFEAIVRRYRRPLLRYCSALLPADRAEDAVQQAFMRAYDAMRSDDSKLHVRPWLYRIAHNTALNLLRDDSGWPPEPLDESHDGVERPDQAFERRERLTAVVAAVQGLPEQQRNALVLRELEGRSHEEIATELGVTGGAARQLLHRARNALRRTVTAVTPPGLLLRVPAGAPDSQAAQRVAELCAGAGGAAVLKASVTLLVTRKGNPFHEGGAQMPGSRKRPPTAEGDPMNLIKYLALAVAALALLLVPERPPRSRATATTTDCRTGRSAGTTCPRRRRAIAGTTTATA
jgi:RNA polymerase sigma factor (sigma-70 family)